MIDDSSNLCYFKDMLFSSKEYYRNSSLQILRRRSITSMHNRLEDMSNRNFYIPLRLNVLLKF